MLRKARACLLLAGLLLAGGCWAPKITRVPAEEIAAAGTAVFEWPREKVFRACVAALEANGYRVDEEDAGAGVVFTGQMAARTFRNAREGTTHVRRYEITVAEEAGPSARVAAVPILSDARSTRGEVSVLRRRGVETAWTLAEERAEWRRLFDAIEKELAVPDDEPARAGRVAENTP